MRHVVCIIHRNHVTIERDNLEIGIVKSVNGEPIISLVEGRDAFLTFTDLEIIQDNWDSLQELGGAIDKVVDKAVDKLAKIGKLSV